MSKKDKNRGANFINAVIEIGTEPLFMIITTVFTVAAGVCVNFFEESTILYAICDRGFYISLSLVLVQLMLQVFGIRQAMAMVQENVSSENNVIFPKDKADIDKMMQDQLSNPRASYVKIICYGTNKYGKIIDQIINDYNNIKQLDVIVFSPDSDLFAEYERDSDRIRLMLKETVEEFESTVGKEKNRRKLNLYCSEIPPTIRASVVYDNKGQAMWCTSQSYSIFLGEGTLFRGQAISPAIVAQDEHSSILGELTANFEKEYERLVRASVKFDGKTKD